MVSRVSGVLPSAVRSILLTTRMVSCSFSRSMASFRKWSPRWLVNRTGAEYAENVRPGVTREDLDRAAEEVDARLQSIWEELVNRIHQECSEVLPTMTSRLEELHDSHRFQSALGNLNTRASGPDVSRILGMARDAARGLSEVSRIAARNSSAVASGATGLSRFSGSFAHGTVLIIGRFMGHSFRPWEAVKLARGIETAGTGLSVAAIGLSVYLQIREDREEPRERRRPFGHGRN